MWGISSLSDYFLQKFSGNSVSSDGLLSTRQFGSYVLLLGVASGVTKYGDNLVFNTP